MKWATFNVAELGRTVGALFILTGIALTAWDLSQAWTDVSSNTRSQFFIVQVLSYAFPGFTIILVSEVVSRMRWFFEALTEGAAELPNQEAEQHEPVGADPLLRAESLWAIWNDLDVVQLGRMAGIAIAVVGILVSAWGAIIGGQDNFPLGVHQSARSFLGTVLLYSYQGMLIILLAEIANRVGPWREEAIDEAVDEPEAAPQAP